MWRKIPIFIMVLALLLFSTAIAGNFVNNIYQLGWWSVDGGEVFPPGKTIYSMARLVNTMLVVYTAVVTLCRGVIHNPLRAGLLKKR
jgi:hypothetical protein